MDRVRRWRRLANGQLLPFAVAVVIVAIVVAIGAGYAVGRTVTMPSSVDQVPGGDPAQGGVVMEAVGCGSCHQIPGVESADGRVGPPLSHWSDRDTIAGRLPNTGEDLIAWLMDPQAIDHGTDMPNLGLSRQQARDVAAYLFSLR